METNYYNTLPLQSNSMDYSGLHATIPTSLPLPPSLHKTENIGTDGSSLITNSILMSNGMEGAIHSEEIPMTSNSWPTSTSAAAYTNPYQQHLLSTPPPEGNTFPPAYSFHAWQAAATYGIASNQVVAASCMGQQVPPTGNQSFAHGDPYVLGSSLEESPLSSPSSCEGPQETEDPVYLQNQVAISTATRTQASHCNSIYGMTATGYEYVMAPGYATGMVHLDNQDHYEMGIQVPKGVKMPQRKGGIQLWQFLYSLLTSSDSKHREIIEWTANVHEREFRMLEPESIAVWWGHHKNKPNMSYDKFSRSLRYYYDKGILKKIPGERYVYRFLIDPEHMYRHIGTSDCRPKLKPMPQAAKVAMSKYQQDSSIDFKASSMPIITQDPEPLEKSLSGEPSSIKKAERSEEVTIKSVTSKSTNKLFPSESVIQNSSSTGNLLELEPRNSTGSLSMKRSRSLECASNYSENSPNPMALNLNTVSCPPTLRNSFESFPTLHSNNSYSQAHSSTSNEVSITFTTNHTGSESQYTQASYHANSSAQVNPTRQLYYSQSKSKSYMDFSPGHF